MTSAVDRMQQDSDSGPASSPAPTVGDQFAGIEHLAKRLKPFVELVGFVGLAAVPLLMIRLMVASGGDQTVALAVARNVSLQETAIALAITMTSYVSTVTLGIVAGYYGMRWGYRAKASPEAIPIFSVALLLVFLGAGSWWEFLGFALLSLGVCVFQFFRARRKAAGGERAGRVVVAWAFLGVLAIQSFTLNPSFWLAPEKMVVAGTEMTVSVLRVDGTDLVVFDRSAKVVLRIASGDVTERQFCSMGRNWPPFKPNGDSRPRCPG